VRAILQSLQGVIHPKWPPNGLLVFVICTSTKHYPVTKNVRKFLANQSIPVVLDLPYSLDLASFSFFLLPRLKIIPKEKQYFKAPKR
jgi:hypothetical protein